MYQFVVTVLIFSFFARFFSFTFCFASPSMLCMFLRVIHTCRYINIYRYLFAQWIELNISIDWFWFSGRSCDRFALLLFHLRTQGKQTKRKILCISICTFTNPTFWLVRLFMIEKCKQIRIWFWAIHNDWNVSTRYVQRWIKIEPRTGQIWQIGSRGARC